MNSETPWVKSMDISGYNYTIASVPSNETKANYCQESGNNKEGKRERPHFY